MNALREFFPDGNGGYDYEAAREMMDKAALYATEFDWQAKANRVVDPEQVVVSEDGKTVMLEGERYSFAEVRAKEGNLYIVVAKPVTQDNLLTRDQVHMVDPMLIGGAKVQEGATQEEQTIAAYSDARGNLSEAFEFWSKPHNLVVGQGSGGFQGIVLSKR
jgi:hypothetical protein